jgi:hypothetical protein
VATGARCVALQEEARIRPPAPKVSSSGCGEITTVGSGGGCQAGMLASSVPHTFSETTDTV